jgi:hypothetical protein
MKKYMKYLFLIMFVCLLAYMVYMFFGSRDDIELRGREVLLQQTDFHELLKAGQELIKQAEWKDYIDIHGQKGRYLVLPEDKAEPEVFQILQQKISIFSMDININDSNSLTISFDNRDIKDSFGVCIHLDNSNLLNNRCNQELIPGLWYWDEKYYILYKNGLKYDTEYENFIKEMIKKNKYLTQTDQGAH